MKRPLKKHFNEKYTSGKDVSEISRDRIRKRLERRLKVLTPVIKRNKQMLLEEILYHYRMLEFLESRYVNDFETKH